MLLWVFGFFSLGTQLLIAQYLPTLLQLPVPGLDTVQSSTVVGWYGFASVLGAIVLGLVLGRASRFWVIGTNLVLAAVMLLVVALVPNPGFETLLPLLTVFAFIVPTAVGPTRNVLAVNAYPAEIRATGVGATELSARLGSATGGALGGTLIGAGLGISGVMLVLLVPIAILLMSLLGIGMQSRR
ncbi:MAG: aromatic acid/H+ symport family MFS transporter [Microbacteriaceae bacterium]|nr:aromatic acid/H+ symport family MFS transporter [Microbacteriaceae bacterium]